MAKGVGVYVGRNEIIAVSAVHTIKGPQIKEFAIEPIVTEEPKAPSVGKEVHKIKKLSLEAQAIHRALRRIKEPGAYVTAAVSPFQVATRHFIMPAVPKKEEVNAVRFEASRYIPFKLKESVLDYYATPTHRNVNSITATAIRQDELQTCLDDLRAANAKVLMVEPVYCAVSRVFASLNMISKEKTHGFVLLQSDGNVNVTFASKGIVYLSRDFLVGGTSDEDKSRFYNEIKASIDYFYKLTGGEGIGQIFLAGAGDLKLWVEYLEQKFNYEIRFDLANFSSEKKIPSETINSVLVALGLAMRSMKYQSPLGDIKLLPLDERRSPLPQFLTFLAIESAIIIALFLLIRLVAFQPYLMNLQEQSDAVLRPLKEKDPVFMSKSLAQLNNQEKGLRSRVGQIKGFFKSRQHSSALLTALGQGMPDSISLDYVSLEDAVTRGRQQTGQLKKRLNLKGFCYLGSAKKETAAVSAWVSSLLTRKAITDRFAEIKLEGITRQNSMGVELTRFRIIGE